jgi:hypothetical protein
MAGLPRQGGANKHKHARPGKLPMVKRFARFFCDLLDFGEGFPFQQVDPQRLGEAFGLGFRSWSPRFLGHPWTNAKTSAICQVLEGCARGRPVACHGLQVRRCCSSVVEHSIGNGEVDSSILSSSTTFRSKYKDCQFGPRHGPPGHASVGMLSGVN